MFRSRAVFATVALLVTTVTVGANAQPPEGQAYPMDPTLPPPEGPESMDYEEGQPIPYGYHVDTKPRAGLVISGGVLFGVGYLSAIVVGAVGSAVGDFGSGEDGNGPRWWPMFFPFAGPFIAIETANTNAGSAIPLVVNGVAQVGGAALLIAGLAAPESVLVRNDVASIQVTPVVLSDGSVGIGAAGSF